LGVILFALSTHTIGSTARTWIVILAYIAALSSLIVSYARARAEGLGMSLKSGLMARPERLLLLAVGLIIGGESWLVWTLAFLAVTSTFTAIQRIITVWLKLSVKQDATQTSAPTDERTSAPNNHADTEFPKAHPSVQFPRRFRTTAPDDVPSERSLRR
jgi:CDP-diacylglycerol---glycerol-3-phosphate 3-phosphatidyltransferase